MTKQEITVFITKMHPVTLAITEEGTIATSIFFHPIAVTEWLEAFFPYLHKIVPIDIPLMKITPDTGTSRDRTVYQDRTDSNTGITSKEAIAYFSFVLAEKAFAAITQMYLSSLRISLMKSISPVNSSSVSWNSGCEAARPTGKIVNIRHWRTPIL